MRKTIFVFAIFVFVIYSNIYSQDNNAEKSKAMETIRKNTDIIALSQKTRELNEKYLREKKEVEQWLKKAKMEKYVRLKNGKILWIKKIKNGRPVFYSTYNIIAAITTSTNKVQPGGESNLNLDGDYLGGMDMGIWDGGIPNKDHVEFTDQYNNHHLIIADTSSNLTIEDHPTHVAGTLIGDGSDANAKGMAWGAILRAWDFENDLSEISYAVSHSDIDTPYLTLSNHSYGSRLGWAQGLRNDPNNWYWTSDEIFHTLNIYITKSFNCSYGVVALFLLPRSHKPSRFSKPRRFGTAIIFLTLLFFFL